jgi:four helix bundle protein
MRYLTLKDIRSYKIAFDLSNYIWDIVIQWHELARFTVGKQLINSADSVSANIAEGFGRYHKKDKVRFYNISRGSLFESTDWIEKAKYRKLINEEQYKTVINVLETLPKEINMLIKYTNEKLRV